VLAKAYGREFLASLPIPAFERLTKDIGKMLFGLSLEPRPAVVCLPHMKLRSSALSDVGRVRPENEDSFLCNETLGIFGVADGIGGLPSGAQASQMAMARWTGFSGTTRRGENGLRAHPDRGERPGLQPRPHSQPPVRDRLDPDLAHLVGVKLNILHVGDSAALRLRSKALGS